MIYGKQGRRCSLVYSSFQFYTLYLSMCLVCLKQSVFLVTVIYKWILFCFIDQESEDFGSRLEYAFGEGDKVVS